ncbi:MAG: putative quinol monooxygenase [Spirochaetales bacterium]|nr:putative quinol monooxygenase [Spirochaetales bacterium]
MLTVLAHSTFKEDSLDKVAQLYRELIEQTRKEDGCIEYRVVQSTTNPGHLTMIEIWRDKEALEKHGSNPDFQNLVQKLAPHSLSPTEIQINREFL